MIITFFAPPRLPTLAVALEVPFGSTVKRSRPLVQWNHMVVMATGMVEVAQVVSLSSITTLAHFTAIIHMQRVVLREGMVHRNLEDRELSFSMV